MDKISIIIPVYNMERYLEQCLASVTRQTYPHYEVIMVDDGSTDSSAAIARRFAERDDRFVLIKSDHRGSAGARNVGLENFTGEFVAFLDGDDWYDDDFLESLHRDITAYHADICYCNFTMKGRLKYDWDDAVMTGREALFELLTAGCSNEVPNKLYRGSILKGIRFPDGRDLCEDAAFTALALVRAQKVVRRKASKYNIRLTRGSVTRKHFRRESEICAFYRNLLDRCRVFMDNVPEEDAFWGGVSGEALRQMARDECVLRLKMPLDSGISMDHWDVYQTGRKLVLDYAEELQKGDYRIPAYYAAFEDFGECRRQYFRDVMTSRSQSPTAKMKIAGKYLMAAGRRLLIR